MVCFLVYMYNVQVYQAYQVLQYHLSVSATLTYRLPLNLLSVHGIRTQNIIYTHTLFSKFGIPIYYVNHKTYHQGNQFDLC